MEEVKKRVDFGTREMPQLIANSREAKVKLSTLSQNFHGLSKYAQETLSSPSTRRSIKSARMEGLARGARANGNLRW
jgi:hypothetical protein